MIWFKQWFGVQVVKRVIEYDVLKWRRERVGVLDIEIHKESWQSGFIFPPWQPSFLGRCLLKKQESACKNDSDAIMLWKADVTYRSKTYFTDLLKETSDSYHHHFNVFTFFKTLTKAGRPLHATVDVNDAVSFGTLLHCEVSDVHMVSLYYFC